MNRDRKVDGYVAETPEVFRPFLSDLRDKIHRYFPEGEETFAYNIPVYKYKGKAIFSIAAFKHHYSIVTQDKFIKDKVPELNKYPISGTTLHFTPQNPLTDDDLRRIIRQRLMDRS